MRAANRGDATAYRRLLQAVTPVLRGVVRARGAALGPEGCEDVVQEVLLAIHLKRQTWREDAPLRPWLYAIARHKVVDAFRAAGSGWTCRSRISPRCCRAEAPDPTDGARHGAVLDQARAARGRHRAGLRPAGRDGCRNGGAAPDDRGGRARGAAPGAEEPRPAAGKDDGMKTDDLIAALAADTLPGHHRGRSGSRARWPRRPSCRSPPFLASGGRGRTSPRR
jgi:DNA-directed RNA polymerase specialized sigma24 family protein